MDKSPVQIALERIQQIKKSWGKDRTKLDLSNLELVRLSLDITDSENRLNHLSEDIFRSQFNLSTFEDYRIKDSLYRLVNRGISEKDILDLQYFTTIDYYIERMYSSNLIDSETYKRFHKLIEPNIMFEILSNLLQLSGLPDWMSNLENLTSLDLSNNQLSSLPDGISKLKNLISLDFSNNRLSGLPDGMLKSENLTSLDLSNNQLSSLPDGMVKFKNLTSLNLSNNLFKNPPFVLWKLKLHELDISHNQISYIPAEVGLLKDIRKFNISHNQIQFLPPYGIIKLTSLTFLDISNNRINKIPAEIGQLSQLQDLRINSNPISILPPEIRKLDKSLKQIDLRDTVLSIPPEILERSNDPAVILEAYFSPRRLLLEAKLVIVGQGAVGKTSLSNRLNERNFDSQENKTEGISITRLSIAATFQSKNQSKIQLNIWDFGGQEIMHATHQFFLTKRSLYLLVLDSRLTQEENRVEYWLKIIQSFSDESPILIVGNKTDQHPLDIDRTGLQKKYHNIVGFIETSAATGTGIKQLKAAITEQVNRLPHVRDALPESWFTVKSQLEKLGRQQNFITHDRYLDLCFGYNINDKTSQHTLIGFLHDLGIVLHFQDDPRLEALGILNPQWVTNGVYKILNAHALFQNKGVLERSMLADILPEDDYPANKRLFIVDMMRKFELCYDIVPEQTFLVPDLLPKDEPFTGEWDGALAFQYHYNVLPSSIVSRFIVRMNAYIHKTVWRAGVVLQKDGNTALVKADMEERKIYIWVNGAENTRRDFLSVIRAEFDAIHKTIIKIEAVQKVPHPDYPDLVLDYAELLQFERDNIAEFPRSVDGKTVMVNVRQLLNGVRVGSEPVPVVKSVPPPAAAPVKVETAPVQPAAGNQSMLVRILSAVFVSLPRVIGRFALDIFGRGKDSADSTFVLLGYVLLILSALVVWGIVDIHSLRDSFTAWWRFFFPVK